MNFFLYLFSFIVALAANVSMNGAWRLGKPHHITPSISSLNTYTLSPIKTSPQTTLPQEGRQLVKAIQRSKNPEQSEIVIHEKSDQETERTKFIKGYSLATQGVPSLNSSHITIVSRGYALREKPKHGLPRNGGGVVDAYSRLRNNIGYTPLVVFDLPDQRRSFNFGQELDNLCLKTVYNEVISKNPNAKIILSGDCRGALNVLRFATSCPTQVDTLVLLSPFVSAWDVTQELGKNYLQKYLGKNSGKLLHSFFQWWFPNYDPAQDNVMDFLHSIKGKKIFIAHRSGDTLIADVTVKTLAALLKKENDVYLAIIHDNTAKHSKLMQVTECQELVNAFYERYSIQCDATLAKRGQNGLGLAKNLVESL